MEGSRTSKFPFLRVVHPFYKFYIQFASISRRISAKRPIFEFLHPVYEFFGFLRVLRVCNQVASRLRIGMQNVRFSRIKVYIQFSSFLRVLHPFPGASVQNVRFLRVLHPFWPALSPRKWLNTLSRRHLRQIRPGRRNATFLRGSALRPSLLLNSSSICMGVTARTLRFQASQRKYPGRPNFHFSSAPRLIFTSFTSISRRIRAKRPTFASFTSIAAGPFASK